MPSKAAQIGPKRIRKKMLISAKDYQRMGAAGIFMDKPRVELIDGEIYTMSPFTPEHNAHVDKISRFFNKALFDEIIVRTQGSVRTDEYSEPEPDIAVLRYSEHFYSQEQVTAKDIHLLIEVTVNTLETDRVIKKKKYAEAGIQEYWIVIPPKGIIEVYKNVKDGSYLKENTYTKTEEWVFEAFGLSVKGSDLLI
jgi:Uma2 family endonuclease